MWKVINLADLPGWVKKVTAFSRWLFFGTGCWGIVGWIYGVFGYVLLYRLFYLLFYIENFLIKVVF